MTTVSSMARIASTAAWSAAILSPRPIQRPAPIAAASVTRTSSSARLRSGVLTAERLHPFGRFHAYQVEAARDHALRRPAEPQPERLLLDAEDAALVVEAVE